MTNHKQHYNFYIVTGGPGVGKTTVLKELSLRKYHIVQEVARELIKEEQNNNGNALPWKDKNLFKELMFERSFDSYLQTKNSHNSIEPIFFDRSFIDAIGYAHLEHLEISNTMQTFAKNYRFHKKVFILPPWKEIYTKDSEREQNWEEAVHTNEIMKPSWRDLVK